jgi:hypothetical protein
LIHAANVIQFAHVKLSFFALQKLVQIDSAADHPQGQTVRFDDPVNVVGCGQRAGTGHILHDDVRVSGNVFGHVTRKNPRVLVVETAGGKADDDADRLTLVKRRGLS